MAISTAVLAEDLPYMSTAMVDTALVSSRLLHRGGLPPAALQRVRQYIEDHLEHGISLEHLAGICRLSPSHFGRAFKQSEGQSPYDYLLERRVRRVQKLLALTDMPLSQIAVACGFADQSHCSRRFRERVGIPPSRYRWMMR